MYYRDKSLAAGTEDLVANVSLNARLPVRALVSTILKIG